LGILSLRIPPLFLFGILITAVFLFATLKRPEISLLIILVFTSSILFEDRIPVIPIGFGSLHIPDLLLLWLLGLIVLRWVLDQKFRIERTPLDWPLLIFFSVTLLSTFIAILQSSVEIQDALRRTRILSYYLTFFIVTNLVKERRQLNFLLNGIFFLASIVAAAMVAQFLLGDSVKILPGRVESLITQQTVFEDITRILPPGFSIVMVSFVTILCISVLERFKTLRSLKFLQCCLLGAAILVTFLRSYWAPLIMVIFILAYLFKGFDRRKLIGWGMVVICSATMIWLVASYSQNSRASILLRASIDRLSTLFKSETLQGQDSSVNYRMIESRYAFSSIASHPLIGMGMGFTYRPWDSRIDRPHSNGAGYDFRKHIHNGHLQIMLQSGLLGYSSLTWLSLTFLLRGFKYWRRIASDRMRGVVLGFTLIYLVVLIAALANSTFMQWFWTPVIGIIMGINEVILRKVPENW
jgi:O-antigen ligase